MPAIQYTRRRKSGTYVFVCRSGLAEMGNLPISWSLWTKNPSVARIRAAAARAALPRVINMVQHTLSLNGGARSASQTSALIRAALDAHLGFATKDQLYAPDPDEARANLIMHDYFKLAAQYGGIARMSADDEAKLVTLGRDKAHMQKLKRYITYNHAHSAMSERHLALQLEAFNIPFNTATVSHDRRAVLEAFANAQALAPRLHDPVVQASPAPLEFLLSLADPFAKTVIPAVVTASTAVSPLIAASDSISETTGSLATITSEVPMLSEVIEDVVNAIVRIGKWSTGRGGTSKDALRVIKQFGWTVGDRPINAYTQKDCAKFAEELSLMPIGLKIQKLWHRPYKEVKGDFPTGSAFNPRNPLTINKELSYFSTFADHMHIQGHWTKAQLTVEGLKTSVPRSTKKKAKKPWTVDLMRIFFLAPIWRGCAGFHGRLKAHGKLTVYHDAAYWLLLMLWWMGLRLNEAAGLQLVEVITDGVHHPHIKVVENSLRTIKTEAGERFLPIPQRLIDLGFLDYVDVMRSEGHGFLFPELWLTGLSGGDQFARIVWNKLLRWFLQQPGAYRPEGAGGKLADMHSIRTCFVSMTSRAPNKSQWRQMVGHEGEGVTEITYDRLVEMGELQAYLTDIKAIMDMFVIDPCPDLVGAPIKTLPIKARSR
jgi:integrase